jgi:hypothetical protein
MCVRACVRTRTQPLCKSRHHSFVDHSRRGMTTLLCYYPPPPSNLYFATHPPQYSPFLQLQRSWPQFDAVLATFRAGKLSGNESERHKGDTPFRGSPHYFTIDPDHFLAYLLFLTYLHLAKENQWNNNRTKYTRKPAICLPSLCRTMYIHCI